ncbi:hypothetical protein EMCRGX_G019758 [Ephydatia muelleri]
MAILRSFTKIAAYGASGLRIQHLLDAVEVPSQFPICSSLRDLVNSLNAKVNLLASGKVPVIVSKYLAGGSLTALMQGKGDLSMDIRPTAVGEALRCLAMLDECATQFQELLPWASWCYSQHPLLRHHLVTMSSEVGVQGDPISPLFFCLVLHVLVSAIATELAVSMWYQDDGVITGPRLAVSMWYRDDGVITGPRLAVSRALAIIQEQGPALALGDAIFCAKFVSQKCAMASKLLTQLEEAGTVDPQKLAVDGDKTIPGHGQQTSLLPSAVFDITVTSPLHSINMFEAGMYQGVSAKACIPLTVESYGAWGPEALRVFTQVATRLAICAATLTAAPFTAAITAAEFTITASGPVHFIPTVSIDLSPTAITFISHIIPSLTSGPLSPIVPSSQLKSSPRQPLWPHTSLRHLPSPLTRASSDASVREHHPLQQSQEVLNQPQSGSQEISVLSGCRSRILLFASIVTQIVANSLFLSHSVKCMSQLQAQDPPGFQLPPPQLFLAGITVVSQQALLEECATHFPELFRHLGAQLDNWQASCFDLTVVSLLNSILCAGATIGSTAGKAEVRKHNANDLKCIKLARLALQLQSSKSKAITNIYQRLTDTHLSCCNARALPSRARFQHSEDKS